MSLTKNQLKDLKKKMLSKDSNSLNNIRKKAETGVNYISVGAITQSARCIDIGLDA